MAETTDPSPSTPRPSTPSPSSPRVGFRRPGPALPRVAGPGHASRRRRQKRFQVRKKVCRFCVDKTPFIRLQGPQDPEVLITERGKILPRRISGNCPDISADHRAIQRGRNIALLPFSGERPARPRRSNKPKEPRPFSNRLRFLFFGSFVLNLKSTTDFFLSQSRKGAKKAKVISTISRNMQTRI